MNTAGLFAGIGGFERAFATAGWKPCLLCEIDPAARSVLQYHFPDVPLGADICDLRRLPPEVEVLAAGFPCQDLSSSGEKGGIRGARSSLVGEVFRLLSRKRVEWVLIENVPFMLHLRGGEAIEQIVSGLEALGYAWAYRVLNSNDFGVPQRRHRVFIVASKSHDPRQVLFGAHGAGGRHPALIRAPSGSSHWPLDVPIGFYWTEGTFGTGLALNAVPPLKAGSTIGIPSAPAILRPDGDVRTPDIRDAERLQGFPAGWTKPAEQVARSSIRWKLVGNAVTVNTVAWIVTQISAPGALDTRAYDSTPLAGAWPAAAWGHRGKRFAVSSTAQPSAKSAPGIATFLKFDGAPLSRKATAGFLSRVAKGNLRFPAGFIAALQAYGERRALAELYG